MAIQVRHPGPDDSLDELLGPLAVHRWNREQILVAEVDRRLVGIVILWDGGHDLLWADHFLVLDAYRKQGVGMALVNAIHTYAAQHQRTQIVFHTANVDMAYWVKKRGGTVSGPLLLACEAVVPGGVYGRSHRSRECAV